MDKAGRTIRDKIIGHKIVSVGYEDLGLPGIRNITELTLSSGLVLYPSDGAASRNTNLVIMYQEGAVEVSMSKDTIIHGQTCPKAIHDGTGFLHEATDDNPYVVDAIRYCGRCHRVL